MSINQRLKILITNLNVKDTDFAKEINVTRQAISNILSGNNKPSYEIIEKIGSKYKNLNLHWLILGIGEVFIDAKAVGENNGNFVGDVINTGNMNMVNNLQDCKVELAVAQKEIEYLKKIVTILETR